MQPVIGVTMCLDDSGTFRQGIDYSYIRREYGQQLRQAGAQPVFLEPSIDPLIAAGLCDGVVISGGEDIDPALYGQTKAGSGKLEPLERTEWERQLIDACDQKNIPILGICYGSQLLNVHYGGSLYQDIASQYGSDLDHGSSGAAANHTVSFEHDFLGFMYGESVESASRHHQAVNVIAPGFKVMARADDGVIEAIAGRGHYGVQWHAESDSTAARIYGPFVDACRKAANADEFSGIVSIKEMV